MEPSQVEQTSILKDEYDVVFASRMAAAGLTPSTRIGIAVSGGPDSTALCTLASRWISQNGGSSSNLMGFIVDHGLRIESASEALIVQSRIASLGIRCEVLNCCWPVGVPVHGHVQEAARNVRYELIHKACKRNSVDVLLTAHHLDDQIELFIIRFTRHSGLAGLAGMPFVSKLYRCIPEYAGKDVVHALLLVRPLLGLSKNELYEVCKKHDQLWVDDPTNKKPVFLRNVVRSILNKPEFGVLKNELPPLIVLCGKLRTLFDKGRDILLCEAVSTDEVFGYVIVDITKLKHVKTTEQSLKRMLVALLQFVVQKEKPPRGNVVQNLVDHIKRNHLKGALTLAGCNICGDPRSRQSRIIVCVSRDSKLPASAQPVNIVWAWDPGTSSGLCSSGRVEKEASVPAFCIVDNTLEVERMMKVKNPLQLLSEAEEAGMLSGKSVMALSELLDRFSLKSTNHEEGNLPKEKEKHVERRLIDLEVPCGHACYFMNRFWIAWGSLHTTELEVRPCSLQLAQECGRVPTRSSCMWSERALRVRYMEEKDWTFLSQCAKQREKVVDCQESAVSSRNGAQQNAEGYTAMNEPQSAVSSRNGAQQNAEGYTAMNKPQCRVHALPCCFNSLATRAQEAVAKLKGIPLPVRRGLPVFITSQGALISIPSLGFSLCPNIWVFSRFCPKVPLGGGLASWL